jgi:xanthine dehydrogenase accessory factor
VKRSTLHEVLLGQSEARALVLATDLESGEEWVIEPHATQPHPSLALRAAALSALRADRSQIHEEDGRRIFLHVFNPPVRVVIVGAVHIAQPLSSMVREAGYAVVVVDPREAFATEERFPKVPLRVEWPDEALRGIGIDSRTAIVTVTHDPKLDDPALQAALKSDAFYIGALGSRRTHGKRLQRLKAAGFSEGDCERIHAPIGLDIGAQGPGEIATSVMAEIVSVLRRPPAQRSRDVAPTSS